MTARAEITASAPGLADRLRPAGEWGFAILIFGCAVTGGGRYLSFGPLTLRLILGGLLVLLAIPLLWADRKAQLKNPVNWFLLAFWAWLALEALLGLKNGNNREVWASDIKGFAWMALIPAAQVLLTGEKALRRVAKAAVLGAFLQSLIVLGFDIYLRFSGDPVEPLNNFLHEIQWGAADYGFWEAFRLFGNSSVYLMAAAFLLLYEIVRAEKYRWGAAAVFAVILSAVIMTVTRALYGAFGIALILYLPLLFLLFPENKKKTVKRLLLTLGIGLFWILLLETVLVQGLFEFAVARTFHFNMYPYSYLRLLHGVSDIDPEKMKMITDASDNLRAVTKQGLTELFRQSPLIGRGLGATSQLRDEADEYFYLDLLARTGIVGLVLWALPLVFCVRRLISLGKEKLQSNTFPAAAAFSLVPILIVTYFNPWMNAVLGIAWLSFVLAVPNVFGTGRKEL